MMSEPSLDHGSCSFLNLSRELRDHVYEYAIGRQTNFIVVDTPFLNDRLFDDPDDKYDEEGGATILKEDLEPYTDSLGLPVDVGCLSYEINPFYPRALLLVSKQINTESSQVLVRAHASLVNFLKPYTFRRPKNVLQRQSLNDPKLRDFLESSEIVLRDPDIDLAMRFLNVNMGFEHKIHNLVLTKAVLYGGNASHRIQKAWTSYNSRSYSPFMKCLSVHPGINEMAVYIPNEDDEDIGDYCKQAPLEAIKLLMHGRLRAVRFFCREVLDPDQSIIDMNSDIVKEILNDIRMLEIEDLRPRMPTLREMIAGKVMMPQNIVIAREDRGEARRLENAGTVFSLRRKTTQSIACTQLAKLEL